MTEQLLEGKTPRTFRLEFPVQLAASSRGGRQQRDACRGMVLCVASPHESLDSFKGHFGSRSYCKTAIFRCHGFIYGVFCLSALKLPNCKTRIRLLHLFHYKIPRTLFVNNAGLFVNVVFKTFQFYWYMISHSFQ